MYPISKLIVNKLKEYRLTVKKLAAKLGYEDIKQGDKEIKDTIQKGEYFQKIEKNLHKVFNMEYNEVKYAFIRTIKIKNKEKIKKLNQMKNSNKTGSTAKLSVIIKKRQQENKKSKLKLFRKIAIPNNIQSMEWYDQINAIQGMIQNHYKINSSLLKNQNFKIAGYAYYRYKDDNIYEKVYFNIFGNVIKVISPDFCKIICELTKNINKVTQKAKAF